MAILPYGRQPENGVMVHAWRYLDPQGAPIDLIESAASFFQKTYYQISKTGEVQPLALPRDADIVGYIAGQLVVQLKSAWHRANQSYPAGSLIAVKLNKGTLGAAQCLITPTARQAIESVETTRRYIIANLLDNVSGSLHVSGSRCQKRVRPCFPYNGTDRRRAACGLKPRTYHSAP